MVLIIYRVEVRIYDNKREFVGVFLGSAHRMEAIINYYTSFPRCIFEY